MQQTIKEKLQQLAGGDNDTIVSATLGQVRELVWVRDKLTEAIAALETKRERGRLFGEQGESAIRGALLRYEAFENEIRGILAASE